MGKVTCAFMASSKEAELFEVASFRSIPRRGGPRGGIDRSGAAGATGAGAGAGAGSGSGSGSTKVPASRARASSSRPSRTATILAAHAAAASGKGVQSVQSAATDLVRVWGMGYGVWGVGCRV